MQPEEARYDRGLATMRKMFGPGIDSALKSLEATSPALARCLVEFPFAEGHISRISQLMSLAIRFEQVIQEGVARDQADLTRLTLVHRARVTQIMDLLMLAPDIQETLLFLPPVHRGRDPITVR